MTSHEAKMPEMPPAAYVGVQRGEYVAHYSADQMRAMYLAGIAAARGELPVRLHGENEWAEGFNACRATALANLTALEQEAKK